VNGLANFCGQHFADWFMNKRAGKKHKQGLRLCAGLRFAIALT
jgi:hypothetical protein